MNKPIFVVQNFPASIQHDMQSRVTREVPATAKGYDLFTTVRFGLPIIVKGKGTLTGWLLYLDEENYYEHLDAVDVAYGHGSDGTYRETTQVRLDDGTTVNAFIYRSINRYYLRRVYGLVAGGIKVEHGDWMRWVVEAEGN